MPGLDTAVRFRPCHAVGGDYVDVLPLPDGRGLLVIADVVGKGLAAALMAMGVHTVVHSAARRWSGLADLAAALDAHLVETLPAGAFVTVLAMTVDPATGGVEAVNAGHPPAVIFGPGFADRREVAARSGGFMLGPIPQVLTVIRDHLVVGQTMLLCTDGCYEVFDPAGEMLGHEELCRKASGPIGAAADDLGTAADAVAQLPDLWQSAGEPRDDRTVLLVRRRPSRPTA